MPITQLQLFKPIRKTFANHSPKWENASGEKNIEHIDFNTMNLRVIVRWNISSNEKWG